MSGGFSHFVTSRLLRLLPAASRTLATSLERDFCHRRLARRKSLRDDISAQRPEIGDHHARELAAKTAFVLNCGQQSDPEYGEAAHPEQTLLHRGTLIQMALRAIPQQSERTNKAPSERARPGDC